MRLLPVIILLALVNLLGAVINSAAAANPDTPAVQPPTTQGNDAANQEIDSLQILLAKFPTAQELADLGPEHSRQRYITKSYPRLAYTVMIGARMMPMDEANATFSRAEQIFGIQTGETEKSVFGIYSFGARINASESIAIVGDYSYESSRYSRGGIGLLYYIPLSPDAKLSFGVGMVRQDIELSRTYNYALPGDSSHGTLVKIDMSSGGVTGTDLMVNLDFRPNPTWEFIGLTLGMKYIISPEAYVPATNRYETDTYMTMSGFQLAAGLLFSF